MHTASHWNIHTSMFIHQYITMRIDHVCMCRYMHPYAILCSHIHQSTPICMNRFEAACTLLHTWYSRMYEYASIYHYENRSCVHVSLYASLFYTMLVYVSEKTHMLQQMRKSYLSASQSHVCICINMSLWKSIMRAYVATCILMLYYARICVREHADASINA